MYMNGWKDGSLTDGLSVKLALHARALEPVHMGIEYRLEPMHTRGLYWLERVKLTLPRNRGHPVVWSWWLLFCKV